MGRQGMMNKRYTWLANMITANRYQIGAEIGAFKGNTTAPILNRCPTLTKLYVVDLWDVLPEQYATDYWADTYSHFDSKKFQSVKKRFLEHVANNRHRIEILEGISWEMAKYVQDESLDFIFIDADHAYESVYKDIVAWAPKVKPAGMISGHDINLEGVAFAVKELCYKWKEPGIDNCWYCRKEDIK